MGARLQNAECKTQIAGLQAGQGRGVSLLEVILALAILAGAIAVLGEAGRLALRNAETARDLARAQVLCESKLSEIVAGLTAPNPVENTAFDTTNNPDLAGWLYSIQSQPTDETGLISVQVTVSRDLPAAQHPIQFSLVRWMADPNAVRLEPEQPGRVIRQQFRQQQRHFRRQQ